jgi:CheY-like chemotaxis protein
VKRESTPGTKNTIFWADDDPDDLLLFNEILYEHAPNHQVIEFANGEVLLKHLKKIDKADHPCLIVLDMNMPVFDGRQTLAVIKSEEALKSIPVVVFTTSNSSLDKSFCDKHHTEMFSKPASYERLKSTIKNLVEICEDN